jgi:uncharacterized protein (TIGR02453 family)
MRYFTPELFDFLKRLKRNNRREWFLKHKEEYEKHVRQPCLQFLIDFTGPLYEVTPHLTSDPKRSLFRIYRDTRFSPDKRPYKSHAAMRFSHSGKNVHSPGFYLHLEPGMCFAAVGLWRAEPPVLLCVRNVMVDRADEWRKVRHLLNWDDAGKLSRPPRGFPADHEFVEDLKLKDLGSSVEFTEKQVCGPNFMRDFTNACRKMAPLGQFFSKALGLKW